MWFQRPTSLLHHNQFFDSLSFVDVIIKTSDYDIKNSIVMQKTRGLLEPLKLNVARDLSPL